MMAQKRKDQDPGMMREGNEGRGMRHRQGGRLFQGDLRKPPEEKEKKEKEKEKQDVDRTSGLPPGTDKKKTVVDDPGSQSGG